MYLGLSTRSDTEMLAQKKKRHGIRIDLEPWTPGHFQDCVLFNLFIFVVF